MATRSETAGDEQVARSDLPDRLVVAVDSREQRAYQFSDSVVKTLSTGDYSIVGLEDEITVERKSKKDCYRSLGAERERFERELERMAEYRYGAVVVEASLRDFLIPPDFSRMNPTAAIRSLIAWSVRYGVSIFFACDRAHGKAVVRNILERFWRYRKNGVIGDA
jgi:ERCC4-type nuclease